MINPIDFVFEYLDARQTIATLTAERDEARAERDALLTRLEAAEAGYKFHYDLMMAHDAQRKAQRGQR